MSVPLRHGRVLDHRPRFDERSWAYRLAAPSPGFKAEPRLWDCPVWLDQGREGQCVAYAMMHALASTTTPKSNVCAELASFVYHEAQKVDEWPGEEYSGTSVLAGAKIAKREGFIAGYRWAMGIDDVLHAISTTSPVVLGIPWLDSMMTPEENGLLRVSGVGAGGHAILARGHGVRLLDGHSEPEHVVVLRNSWGREWGVDGDCYLTTADLSDLLARGEGCIPVGTPDASLPWPRPDDTQDDELDAV